MISFLVIFPTLLSIIALILSGLEILRCFRYKCLQFGFISVILAFDDGDFNRYDGDRISHKAGTLCQGKNYIYILRLPPRGWYNQWRLHKVTGWQCKAPGAHSRKSEHFRRNLSAAACMDYTSPTTARMSEPRPGASCRAVVEISECKTYTSQHLDFLRRSDFLLWAPGALHCQPVTLCILCWLIWHGLNYFP